VLCFIEAPVTEVGGVEELGQGWGEADGDEDGEVTHPVGP
jgi:hypothetical protein